MLDGFDLGLTDLSASALLAVSVIFILTGRLVPRATLQDKGLEAERWRAAYEAERDARSTADAQTLQLIELARTTHDIVEVAFRPKYELRLSGGDDAVPPQKI